MREEAREKSTNTCPAAETQASMLTPTRALRFGSNGGARMWPQPMYGPRPASSERSANTSKNNDATTHGARRNLPVGPAGRRASNTNALMTSAPSLRRRANLKRLAREDARTSTDRRCANDKTSLGSKLKACSTNQLN